MKRNHQVTNNHAVLTGRLIIILAVSLSAIQFLYNRSLWLDEAMLALNIINKSHIELFQPLDMRQAAPMLYLQLTKLFSIITPETEHGLRLFPLLCFWAALILFYKTARMLFKDTLTFILVISLFALNYSLIYYSSEVKQYMTDVFFAVLFLYLVIKEHSSLRKKHLLLLTTGVLAIWFTNVAPIMLFGSGIYLLHQSLFNRKGDLWQIAGIIGAWLLVFGVYYAFFIHGHPTREFMQLFWSKEGAFMPLNPLSLEFINFLLQRMGGLGRMSFSPFIALIGFFYLFVLIGGVYLVKKKKVATIILLALPLITHLVLSAAEVYPFVGRLILYLTPYVIIAAGYGFKAVFEKVPVKNNVLPFAYIFIPFLFLAQLLWDFPQYRSEIKQSLSFVSDNRQQGHSLYIAPGSIPAYTYYVQTGYFSPENMTIIPSGPWVSSVESFYKNTIGPLSGPCWLVFSHNIEKADYTVERLQKQGQFPVKAFETISSAAYLYHFEKE